MIYDIILFASCSFQSQAEICQLLRPIFLAHLNCLLSDQGQCGMALASEMKEILGKDQEETVNLNVMEPFALQALHELVSLVHDRINMTDQSQSVPSTSANVSAVGLKDLQSKTLRIDLFFLEDDPVAKVLWALDPDTLQNVLIAMAVSFSSYMYILSSWVGILSRIYGKFI